MIRERELLRSRRALENYRGRSIRKAVGLFAGFLFALPSQVSALPPGAPTIELRIIDTQDPLTKRFITRASDPDGKVISIELCVDEPGNEQCQEEYYDTPKGQIRGQIRRGLECVRGDRKGMALTHTFFTEGEHDLHIRATGLGCPVVWGAETTEVNRTVTVGGGN